jgi:SAM-dependent methyltransferase
MRRRLTDYVLPRKFEPFAQSRLDVRSILDVGCANNSARNAKRWFPNATYSGIDIDVTYNSPEIDRFYHLDLDSDSLASVPDCAFDLILFAHVIEHLHHGEAAIKHLAQKLRPGGTIYIETPSERSARLPSGVGCLNFYDDPTHVRLYSHAELEAAVNDAGLRTKMSGIARSKVWLAMGLTVMLPLQAKALFLKRRLFGPALWDLFGFRAFIIAVRD